MTDLLFKQTERSFSQRSFQTAVFVCSFFYCPFSIGNILAHFNRLSHSETFRCVGSKNIFLI